MPAPEVTSYMKTQIETATPLQLVVMLYDGAMENTRKAREAIVAGDVEKKTEAVDKLLAILGELQGTLDMERGGEIATSLNALYTYFCEQVVTASVKLDPEPLDNVQTLLNGIRQAWQEICQRPADVVQAATGSDASRAVTSLAPPEERKRVSVRT